MIKHPSRPREADATWRLTASWFLAREATLAYTITSTCDSPCRYAVEGQRAFSENFLGILTSEMIEAKQLELHLEAECRRKM